MQQKTHHKITNHPPATKAVQQVLKVWHVTASDWYMYILHNVYSWKWSKRKWCIKMV